VRRWSRTYRGGPGWLRGDGRRGGIGRKPLEQVDAARLAKCFHRIGFGHQLFDVLHRRRGCACRRRPNDHPSGRAQYHSVHNGDGARSSFGNRCGLRRNGSERGRRSVRKFRRREWRRRDGIGSGSELRRNGDSGSRFGLWCRDGVSEIKFWCSGSRSGFRRSGGGGSGFELRRSGGGSRLREGLPRREGGGEIRLWRNGGGSRFGLQCKGGGSGRWSLRIGIGAQAFCGLTNGL